MTAGTPGLSRGLTVTGLVVGAAGIAILWAAGIDFPVAVPPGLVILLSGALIVAFLRKAWTPGLGALLGLFVIVGFLISPDGFSNLFGQRGAAVAFGQAVQLIGVLLASAMGLLATWQAYGATRKSGHRARRP
jgi:hypothetical protein